MSIGGVSGIGGPSDGPSVAFDTIRPFQSDPVEEIEATRRRQNDVVPFQLRDGVDQIDRPTRKPRAQEADLATRQLEEAAERDEIARLELQLRREAGPGDSRRAEQLTDGVDRSLVKPGALNAGPFALPEVRAG